MWRLHLILCMCLQSVAAAAAVAHVQQLTAVISCCRGGSIAEAPATQDSSAHTYVGWDEQVNIIA